MSLLPATPFAGPPEQAVRAVLAELEENVHKDKSGPTTVHKYIGRKAERPDYPKVSLAVRRSGYGSYVASVTVFRTPTDRSLTGSLDNLDVRTACEYYARLDSPDALDAVEKVLNAPAPKAWALVTLLDKIKETTT